MLTVISWLWNQPGFRTRYTPETIIALRDMVEKYYNHPHRFVCVTDEDVPGVETIPLGSQFSELKNPTWESGPSCYRRLIAFKRNAAKTFGKRFVSIDADAMIMNDLSPLWNRPERIVLLRGISKQVPYCGTMWMLDAGARPSVWDKFDPVESPKLSKGAGYHGSDQGWLGYTLGKHEATWDFHGDIVDFAHYTRNLTVNHDTPPDARIMFFNGKYKPWDRSLRHEFPWLKTYYPYEQRERYRFCIVEFENYRRVEYGKLMRVYRRSIERTMPEAGVDEITLPTLAKDIRHSWMHTANIVKFRAWVEYLEHATEPVIFSDCDMLALGDAERAFRDYPDFDVAITGDLDRKNLPINGGIVFVRPTQAARNFFRAWLEANEILYADGQLHDNYIARWAGMNQAAFGYLMDHGYPECRLQMLPQEIWNATDSYWSGVNSETVFVHVKGDFRNAVLGRQKPYGPMAECMRKWYKIAAIKESSLLNKSLKASNTCLI